MTKLLSEEKIDEIAKAYKATLLGGNPYFPWFDYAKAIEAEVLEAQKKQEPVGFVDPLAIELAKSKPNNDCLGFRMKPEPGDIPLYAAPVVQPNCNTCTHRGRINGLSQETYCEQCKWHSGVDHYATAYIIVSEALAQIGENK